MVKNLFKVGNTGSRTTADKAMQGSVLLVLGCFLLTKKHI